MDDVASLAAPYAEPAPPMLDGTLPSGASVNVAIIGAGFSGTLLALHLLRRMPEHATVALIERNNQFGRGPAYSSGNASHLLNVPAGKMSAFQGQPGHFLEWLHSLPEAELCGMAPGPGTFVPRTVFGRYVRHLINQELKVPGRRDQLKLVRGDVVDISEEPGRLILALDRGRTITADRAVLAIGNFPPAAPPVADPAFYDDARYKPDPWAADALADLDPDAPVLLIGTGLTTIDTIISLLDQHHRGPITALSRRGLLPHRHAPAGTVPPPETDRFPTRVNDLARALRRNSARQMQAGGTWQSAIDEIRPVTMELWQGMSLADRQRFLRHLRPWWDTHRHRVSGPVADRIAQARESGQLRIRAGRILHYHHEHPDGLVRVGFRPRFSREIDHATAARVVNCAGPDADYSRIRDPLVRTLLGRGLVRPDPLCLGLDVTANCALTDRDGAISRRLFAVGPVTKGAFWEMTAVPDIRHQAETLAGQLAVMVKPR
ncbi:FAD/NAD(P)-binding protein [Acetobacteraceae bacterium KSS8]|uniref:FAD/NAD(P)-binding protein n=1 Tax=Endosaccharibacter trunci TaxID=2812733 RepID=A0ABT1W8K3_9PROT|nr:FAD/NAD(P)-binding protein [Acetobacteraceae bacterium KSS8]